MKNLFRAFVIALFTVFPSALVACSCIASGPPCQAYWNYSVIFSGRVLEIVPFATDTSRPQRLVKFGVSETYRGQIDRIAEIITGQGGGDCGYNFQVGQSYMVYPGMRNDGRLEASICSRTRELSKADDDLEYFRGLSTSKPLGLVFGRVTERVPRKWDSEWTLDKPFSNVIVSIEGPGGRAETRTNETGDFRIPNLKEGDYVLRLVAPKGFYPFNTEEKLKVVGKGCMTFNTSFTRDTSVSGRLTDENGKPITGVSVSLVPVDQINEQYQKDYYYEYIKEQDDGRFVIRSIPPGNYYLGFRLDRTTNRESAYPRTFYPGTGTIDEAAIITVQAGDVLENLNFQLPPKLESRKIEGVIVFPDGKPVPNASLIFTEASTGGDGGCKGKVDPKLGTFEYSCLEGIAYSVRAYANLSGGDQKHAEPSFVPAAGPVNKIKLIISESGGSCAKCRIIK